MTVDEGRPTTPIWARRRPRRPSTLSREAIVEAAVTIADAEGIGAVSIRRVAAELGARTMSLYTHIDSKNDLLDLMAEQMAGEVVIEGDLPAGWREAITLIARSEREAVQRHPWAVDLDSHRASVMIGPNVLRHLDQSVAALAGLKLEPADAVRVIAAIDDYVFGYVTREVREREMSRRRGSAVVEAFAQPPIKDLIDGGEFPNLTRQLAEGIPGAGDNFEHGLTWMLDGIERRFT